MGKPLNRTTDVFSLGICFYELLTLSKMFQAESDLAVLEMVRDARFTPAHEINEAIPREVEDVLQRALAKTPAERFSNGSEMRDELEHFLFKKNLRFSTSWLAGFMHEVFREELDQELAEIGSEAGVIEQLYFEGRRAAQGIPGVGGDTVVIRRANEAHPALIVETSSILRDPPRREREPTEEQESFNPPTEESQPSGELVRGMEDDIEDEDDVSLLQTTLVPLPGHPDYDESGGVPPDLGTRPIWPEPTQEPSLTIQMEERKPTPGLVSMPVLSERRPELPLSPDDFGDSFRGGQGSGSEPSWIQDPPQFDLRILSSSKWTRSQILWTGFFVLCVVIVGSFLWARQGSPRTTGETSEPAARPASGESEEAPARNPDGKNTPELVQPAPQSTPIPEGHAGKKPGEKVGGQQAAAPEGNEPERAGKQAAQTDEAESEAGQKGVGKQAKKDERRDPKDDKKQAKKSPKVAKKPAPREEAAGFGYLDVGIAGSWAYVYIDGVKIKTTPLLNHRVKAGKHRVELKDGEGVMVRRWNNVQVENNDRIKLLHQ